MDYLSDKYRNVRENIQLNINRCESSTIATDIIWIAVIVAVLHFIHNQGRPWTVLRPRQASIFTPPLHITIKLALEGVVIFLVDNYNYCFVPV